MIGSKKEFRQYTNEHKKTLIKSVLKSSPKKSDANKASKYISVLKIWYTKYLPSPLYRRATYLLLALIIFFTLCIPIIDNKITQDS